MTYPITKICVDCKQPFAATGPRSVRCSDCRLRHKRCVRNIWHWENRFKKNDPRLGVGRGGSNKCYKNHPQYKSGMGHFQKLRKVLYAEITECQRCGKSLLDIGAYNKVVHHLDGDRTYNDRKNLMVLCKSCHQTIHKCWKNFEGATTISKESRG